MLKRSRARRPSAAMIVAVIALISALGGSAVADDAVEFAKTKVLNGKNIKKKSIAGNKLRNNTVTGTQVNESKLGKVPSATKSDSATSASSATNAANATKADSATTATTAGTAGSAPPLAYAKVSLTGTVAAATAQGIASANVSRPGAGIYCFDLPFTPKTVLVTPQNDNVSDDVVSAELGVATGCPAGTEVSVQNFDISASALEDDDFFIWLN